MKIYRFRLINKKAFTVVEMIVGLGVLSIALAITLATQFSITKEMKKLDDDIQGKMENLSGEKTILFDIQSANISFNNILIKDDQGLLFFDYIPEKPVNLATSQPDRRITLSTKGAVKEIVILMQDVYKGGLLIYDPTAAYKIGDTTNNFNIAATLNFIGLNQNDRIKNQRPNFWSDGQMLLLDTTARIRKTLDVFSIDEAPVSPIYLGVVDGSRLKKIEFKDLLIRDLHPETGKTIENEDQFLRTMPAVGGGVSTARIQAIKITKYFLESLNNNTGLYKSNYDAKSQKWDGRVLIASDVDSVVFQRQSVSSKIIQFKINKLKTK